jgi:uncharacterized short protein YbdD (DUF466 family)
MGSTGDTRDPDLAVLLETAKHDGVSVGPFSSETPLDGSMRCFIPDCPEPHELQLGSAAVCEPRPAPPPYADSGVWTIVNPVWRGLWRAWRFAREVSGDDAYERYLTHMARAHPGQVPMTRSKYHRFRMEQKWNRISRCC